MQQNVRTLIQEIAEQFDKDNHKLYEPFIRYIRFPYYKRLALDTRIDFKFPLTVLVGANGTNKTSVLQAIYGCPEGKNVGVFWFGTRVDKIEEGEEWKHRIIYGYKQKVTDNIVEVLKTRVGIRGNPDYWEPSRPIRKLGMERPTKRDLRAAGNKNTTRWDLLEKNVVYSDCKEYVSAYDLFFYHTNFEKKTNIQTKQDFIRQRSKHLSEVIDNAESSHFFYGFDCVEEHAILNKDECETIGFIMEKQYEEIHIISHTFYSKHVNDQPAKTIFIKADGEEYSEAFAGSGEARIALLVHDLYNADAKSLILIDEPEISLHPEAIERLKIFLLNQILRKKHQVVISTHSTALVRDLPKEAIKLFYINEGDKNVNVIQNLTDKEAFYSIGHKSDESIDIYVEDSLSKYFIEERIKRMHPNLLDNMIRVCDLPGGVDTIITKNVLASSQSRQKNVYYVLDGDRNTFPYEFDKDKKPITYVKIPDNWLDYNNEKLISREIPEGANEELENILQAITGGNKVAVTPSGKGGIPNLEQKVELQRGFIDYWETNVFFLPGDTPEKMLLSEICPDDIEDCAGNGKEYYKNKANEEVGTPSTEDILNLQKRHYTSLPEGCQLLQGLDSIIERIISEN